MAFELHSGCKFTILLSEVTRKDTEPFDGLRSRYLLVSPIDGVLENATHIGVALEFVDGEVGIATVTLQPFSNCFSI